MSDQFKIAWRNLKTSRQGVSPKVFTQAEAEALALEQNREYPDFIHTAVPCDEAGKVVVPKVEEPQTPPFTPLTDEDPFPFGVHQNRPMGKVPASYLDWISGATWIRQWPAVLDYIERNRASINQDLNRGER